MRGLSILILTLLIALPTVANDLGAARPAKPVGHHVAPPPDPAVLRQGGDTIADAVPIEVHFTQITGTTAGYTDDYDEVCPYSNSTSPDVVYRLVNSANVFIDIDMCGSSYDTKIYVYDGDLEVVACNDDFYFDDYCGVYVSKIEALLLEPGQEYYLVIDGYGGDFGEYHLVVHEIYIDGVYCQSGSELEGEPELVNDYVDTYNGGCNTPDAPGGPPFQHLASELFCGQAGWYQVGDYDVYRDTDWFTLTIPATGELVIVGDADFPSYMFELGPQDCDAVGVLQQVSIGPFMEGTLVIQGEPDSTVWFWIGAANWDAPDLPYEYLYVLWIPGVVNVQQQSWSAVKALFY